MENLNEGMGGSIENEFQDWLDIMLSEKGYEDEIETLETVIDYAQDTLRDYSIDNWVPQTGGSTNENKKMENLNEGKKKASAYMAELAEIDKQSAVVAMEAKINKLAEMVEAKTQRLSMVSEDENLSELIDKKRVKMMEREIKEIEKAKMKLEKLYEKMSGSKKKDVVVDEDARTDAEEEGYLDGMRDEKEDIDEGGYDLTYEEDDTDSMNEEYLRMQKLAGVISEEEMNEKLLGLMSDVSTGGKLGIGTDKGGLIFTKLGKGRYKLTNPTNHPSFREGEVWKPRQDEKTLKVGQSFPRLGDIEGLRVDGESKQKVRT
jgi:hypothetical protein